MLLRVGVLGYLIATLLPSLVGAAPAAPGAQLVVSGDHPNADSFCVDCDAGDDDDSLADEDCDSDEEYLPSLPVAVHYADAGLRLQLGDIHIPESTPPPPLFRPPRHVSV